MIKQITHKATAFFTVAALAYTLALALANPRANEQGEIYMLIFKNYMLIFAYAVVFGVSFLIFKRDKLPPAAQRLLHILVLYVSMLAVLFMMANITDDMRERILFVIFATIIFVIIYAVGTVIGSILSKTAQR